MLLKIDEVILKILSGTMVKKPHPVETSCYIQRTSANKEHHKIFKSTFCIVSALFFLAINAQYFLHEFTRGFWD